METGATEGGKPLPEGVEHIEMPATPWRVWQAIQAARA